MNDHVAASDGEDFWAQQEKRWETIAHEASYRADREAKLHTKWRTIAVVAILVAIFGVFVLGPFCVWQWHTYTQATRAARKIYDSDLQKVRGNLAWCEEEKEKKKRELETHTNAAALCQRANQAHEEEFQSLPPLMSPSCADDYRNARKRWAAAHQKH